MTRILILANKDDKNPQAGGGTIELFRMIKLLTNNGHKVTIFTSKFENADKSERLGDVNIIRAGGVVTTMLLAPWHYLKMRNQYDLILDIAVFGIPYFSVIYSRKPVISFCWHLPRETFSIEMERKWGIIGKLAGMLASWVEDHLYPHFYKNIPTYVVSESTRQDLLRIGFSEQKLRIFPYALSRAMLSYSSVLTDENLSIKIREKTSFPSVLCLGRLQKYKGVQDLIHATALVKKKLPDLKVYVVGKGEYESTLKNLVKELGVEKNIEFTGFVSVTRKFELLGTSRVLVMPSYKEGFPTPVLEAYLCGTTSIVSDSIGVKEYVENGKTGIVYPAGNHKILADRILEYFTNPSLESSLTKNILNAPNAYDDWVKGDNESKLLVVLLHEIELLTNSSTKNQTNII